MPVILGGMSEATEQLGCDWSSSEFQGKQNPLSSDSKFNRLEYQLWKWNFPELIIRLIMVAKNKSADMNT